MSSAYKTSKAELVAIYRLEFYRQKKNWKFCKDVLKGKDSKEKESKETTPAKNSAAKSEKPAKNLLDETYIVDQPAQGLDDAFLESESDTKLAKEPTPPPQTKEEPKGWTNSSRNIALTSILQSEACRELEQQVSAEVEDVTDGPVWSGPRQGPCTWGGAAKEVQPMRVWSEELEWQESGQQQVFQPELWSPTRESPLCFSPDKVWSKEDQIWPQSPESWPEPILWRDNELVWPAAGQQAKFIDDVPLVWPPTSHQQSKVVDETELLWSPATQQSQKAVWPDDSQQARSVGLPQWPPDTKGGGERWEALRGWIEGLPQDLDAVPLSPEVLVTIAEEWLHEPILDQSDWVDECAHACLSRSMCEFMRGAHLRHHSSETELSPSELGPPGPAAGAGAGGAGPVGALSAAALGARVRRHAAALRALMGEARARRRLSAELEDFAQRPHESSSYEEFPTRDVGLQGPRTFPQKPQKDNFISGSFLNDPCFDLGGGSDHGRPHGRGRGRLAQLGSDERVIGIGPGGRPYRL